MPGSIIVGQGGSGAFSNASVGSNGAPAPGSSTEIGFVVGSNLEPVSALNPLPIAGTITATEASVGLIGVTAPLSANLIGVIDSGGKLQGASASNPIRIDPTGTTVQPVSGGIADNSAAPSTTNIGALVATANYNRLGKTNGYLTTLSVDLDGAVRTHQRSENVLGDITENTRYNQIEINFSQTFSATTIANTHVNTGSTTQATGMATYATGIDAAGEGKGVSVQPFSYRPGHEWYAYFTAGWPAGGAASSYQRIGPFNATDGFWLGFEGTVWGVTQYQNSVLVGGTASVAPSIARSAFNGDHCSGATSSAFTSGGVPVALDTTKINIFRLRGAWFGTAPVLLEVFAPDGIWVVLHTFQFPNSLTTPYAYTTNWNLTVDVANTGNTSNLSIITACWSMGATDDSLPLNSAITNATLAPITRTVLTGYYGTGSAYLNVGVDSGGNLNQDLTGVAGSSTSIAAPGTQLVGLADGNGTKIIATCVPGPAAALTVQNIKATAGSVFGVSVNNPNAGTIYLQFYNTTTTPTLGTSVIWWLSIPPGAFNINPALMALAKFTTGIGIGAATTATGNGAPIFAPDVTVFYI